LNTAILSLKIIHRGGADVDISKIGVFLKAARKNKLITQGNVAEQLGISAQAVSKWERGENLPDIAFFPEIARIYGVEVDEILAAGQIAVKRNSFEEDLKKLQARIDLIIGDLFKTNNYETVLEDIMPYTNAAQRANILSQILVRRDFSALEILMPYLGKDNKTAMLHSLLKDEAYDVVEDMMPMFTRKQRDIIVSHLAAQNEGLDIIENFIPFFDKKQRELLKNLIYMED